LEPKEEKPFRALTLKEGKSILTGNIETSGTIKWLSDGDPI